MIFFLAIKIVSSINANLFFLIKMLYFYTHSCI
jgi:hypothetical protein